MRRLAAAITVLVCTLAPAACLPNAGRLPARVPAPACAQGRDAGRPPATVPPPACAEGR